MKASSTEAVLTGLLNRRLLIVEHDGPRKLFHEWTPLEFTSDGRHVKFKDELTGEKLWHPARNLHVVDVLAPALPDEPPLVDEVLDWPLLEVGDEMFFGYVVAIGIIPDWSSPDGGTDIPYVDFAYSDGVKRYRLPADEKLRFLLHRYLRGNLWELFNTDIFSGKVWIYLTDKGYKVDLP